MKVAALTNNSKLYRSFDWLLSTNRYYSYLTCVNAKIDNIWAITVLKKTRLYDGVIRRENEPTKRYEYLLGGKARTPIVPIDHKNTWPQISIYVNIKKKQTTNLAMLGILTAFFHHITALRSTFYRQLGYKKEDFSISEQQANKIIYLFMHPYLASQQIEKITSTVNDSVFSSYK